MVNSDLNIAFIDQIATHPRLSVVFDYYGSLISSLANFPSRRDLDPVGFFKALPSTALVELHRAHGRLRFRLVGQEIMTRVGSKSLSGCWLDRLIQTEYGDAIDGLFGNLLSMDGPVYETGEVQRRHTRTVTSFAKLVLPLAACEGEPETALAVFVFAEPVTETRHY